MGSIAGILGPCMVLNFGLWVGLEKEELEGMETRRLIRDVGRYRGWHSEVG